MELTDPFHLLTDSRGCTYSLLGQISHFSYGSVYALVFIDYHVKVKPDMCFSLLRILLPMLYLLSQYIISKCSKNLKQMKIKANTSSLFMCLFLSKDTLQCMSRYRYTALQLQKTGVNLHTPFTFSRSRSSLFSSDCFTQ